MNKLFDLSGKVALVTGSSRGLGSYMACALAGAGADVVITARAIDTLGATADKIEKLGKQSHPVALDVRENDSIQAAVGSAMERFGRIDILVNNAGCNVRKAAEDVTLEDWELVVNTNLRGQFFMSQAVAKASMLPNKYGRIVNIGSVTCVFGYGRLGPYCASRGGVRQMTMSLADDWGKHGITVNCLAPGWFKTEQTKPLYEDERWVNYLVDRIPMKRPGEPHDLDGTIIFLSSDASAYLTGQTILVDGGITTGATKTNMDVE